ncbi:MAG: hypothetical protein M1825_004891 [Sarcosagium campestre]|nr:MAG: hypothetical protein M1825_004891 [Sarcosagium campestre]
MDNRVIGLLGGGQLGRMLVEAANRLNVRVVVLDAENAPAMQVNAKMQHVYGSFSSPEDIRRLACKSDILTVEIEHVNTKVLKEIALFVSDSELGRYIEIQPSWEAIRTIQDKFIQKEHLKSHGLAVTKSISLASNSLATLSPIQKQLGLPLMLKSKTQAYDGRGNFKIGTEADMRPALSALEGRPLYAEKWAHFKLELAVMVAKTVDAASQTSDEDAWMASTIAYPTVETVHEDSICKLVYVPARGITEEVALNAQNLARRAIATFRGKGIFAVEMFLLEKDELIINEIAPRPHNSGHYTIEGCHISQYEAHLRAILELPFPPHQPLLRSPCIMLNLLGGTRPDSHLVVAREAIKVPGATLHLYGKGDARPGRKMGHVTITGSDMAELEELVQPLIDAVDKVRAGRDDSPQESALDWPSKSVSSAKGNQNIAEGGRVGPSAPVAITMGSDSDLPVLKPGLVLLRELAIPFDVTITSAHRTPGRMFDFARTAADRGVKVIIAAAGGAAHLPGMVAASTPLPVIGVPVKGSTLDGMDSLLSIVQMPRGVPVATVSINNSTNAALLAARILGASDAQIRARLERYSSEMEQGVLSKVSRLEEEGWIHYGTKP